MFYDNKYIHIDDSINGLTERHIKQRLYKIVDKKTGKFLWWELIATDDVKAIVGTYAIENSTCGYADFTKNGDMLELTEEMKNRALTRKIKLAEFA